MQIKSAQSISCYSKSNVCHICISVTIYEIFAVEMCKSKCQKFDPEDKDQGETVFAPFDCRFVEIVIIILAAR